MTALSVLGQRLESELGEGRVERDVPLAPMTTFRIGGPADLLVRARTPDEMVSILQVARDSDVDHFLLGKGANILVGDAGFRGLSIFPDFSDEHAFRAFVQSLLTSGLGG